MLVVLEQITVSNSTTPSVRSNSCWNLGQLASCLALLPWSHIFLRNFWSDLIRWPGLSLWRKQMPNSALQCQLPSCYYCSLKKSFQKSISCCWQIIKNPQKDKFPQAILAQRPQTPTKQFDPWKNCSRLQVAFGFWSLVIFKSETKACSLWCQKKTYQILVLPKFW